MYFSRSVSEGNLLTLRREEINVFGETLLSISRTCLVRTQKRSSAEAFASGLFSKFNFRLSYWQYHKVVPYSCQLLLFFILVPSLTVNHIMQVFVKWSPSSYTYF